MKCKTHIVSGGQFLGIQGFALLSSHTGVTCGCEEVNLGVIASESPDVTHVGECWLSGLLSMTCWPVGWAVHGSLGEQSLNAKSLEFLRIVS